MTSYVINNTIFCSIPDKELQTWHRPRMKALEANGVDIIAFETIPALLEARALIELLYNEFPNTKAWITFSCKV